MTRTRLVLALPLVLVAACSSPAPPPASPTPSGTRVVATVEVGQEAYGLAVTDDAVWATSFQGGTLTRVDPATNKPGAPLRLGAGAATLMAEGGSLWVGGYGDAATVWRIDPASGQVVDTVSPGELCCDFAWDGRAVWAVDPRGSVFRVDGSRVGSRWPILMDRNAHTNVVYAGGLLWASSDTTVLTATDPATGEARQRIEVGGGVPFLVHDGLLWGAAPARLWAIDPATGQIAREVPLTDSTEVLSLGLSGDDIWVGIRRPGRVGAVLRLSATGAVLDELREVDIPARIAFGFGSVWVTDSGSGSLFRIATGS